MTVVVIVEIDVVALKLSRLERLDLSFNTVRQLPHGLASHMPLLHSLLLEGNPLST